MKHLKIIILVLITFGSNAQIIPQSNEPKMLSDKFIRVAIDSSLCIIRQDYILKNNKNNDEYGRNGNDFFGRSYKLGVFSGNKIWTVGDIRTPWIDDRFFDKYLKNDTIKPALSSVAYKPLASYSTAKYEEMIDCKPDETEDSTNVTSYSRQVDFLGSVGIKRFSTEVSGVLVVVSSKESFSTNENATPDFSLYSTTVQFQENAKDVSLKKVLTLLANKDNVLGGVFYATVVITGNIQFVATGMLKSKKDRLGITEWYLETLPIVDKNSSQKLTPLTPRKAKSPENPKENGEKKEKGSSKEEKKKPAKGEAETKDI